MIQGTDLVTLMKDYLFKFADGTSKEFNKNIEIFTIMSECNGICDATIEAFK